MGKHGDKTQGPGNVSLISKEFAKGEILKAEHLEAMRRVVSASAGFMPPVRLESVEVVRLDDTLEYGETVEGHIQGWNAGDEEFQDIGDNALRDIYNPYEGSSFAVDSLIAVVRVGGVVIPFSGGGGSNIYRYTLTSDWSGSSPAANATIRDADGVQLETGKTIKDPLLYMVDQETGDVGHCYKEGEYYYAIQAPCTGSGGGGGSTGTQPPIAENTLVVTFSV